MKLFVREVLSDEAHAVFDRYVREDGAELIVPDLFFIECANVFWKWIRRYGYSPKAASAHMRDVTNLGLTAIPTRDVAGDALTIASRYRITAYDGCYLAVAALLRVPFVTADEALVRQMVKGPYDVRWLGDGVMPG